MHTSVSSVVGLALIAIIAFIPTAAQAATPSASFDKSEITTSSKKPSISGEAEDARTVRVVVRNEDDKIVFRKDARVREGEWRVRISKTLKAGEYSLFVYAGKKTRGTPLDEAELTVIGKKVKSADSKSGNGGTLSASMVPLLTGGTARAGASIPVAYVKLTNTGSKTTSIEGFTLTQDGSAPPSVVTGFATSDDKGGSRTAVAVDWKRNTVFVPLAAELAPGQMRIFTLKANVAGDAAVQFGKTIALNVASISTDAKMTGMFPIRGTVWTLGF